MYNASMYQTLVQLLSVYASFDHTLNLYVRVLQKSTSLLAQTQGQTTLCKQMSELKNEDNVFHTFVRC